MRKRLFLSLSPAILALSAAVLSFAGGCGAKTVDPADANLKISPQPRSYRELHPDVGMGPGQKPPAIMKRHAHP